MAYEIYCVINTLFIQSLFDYASLVGAIGAMVIFLFSVTFFVKVMVEAKIPKLNSEPLIWINTAFLIHYTGNFFYYSMYNRRLIASRDAAILAAELFSVQNIFYSLIITIGFLLVKRRPAAINRKN